MPKLIYVYGDDARLMDTLVTSLRSNGYAIEYTTVKEEHGSTAVMADVRLHCHLSSAEAPCYGGVTLDETTHRVCTETGEELHFTPTEFSLLHYLMQAPQRAVPREELLRAVWHYEDIGGTRVADDTVKRLRKKLADTHLCIETVWGYGFKLKEI